MKVVESCISALLLSTFLNVVAFSSDFGLICDISNQKLSDDIWRRCDSLGKDPASLDKREEILFGSIQEDKEISREQVKCILFLKYAERTGNVEKLSFYNNKEVMQQRIGRDVIKCKPTKEDVVLAQRVILALKAKDKMRK